MSVPEPTGALLQAPDRHTGTGVAKFHDERDILSGTSEWVRLLQACKLAVGGRSEHS
jgi:hypothetical protein